MVATRATSPHQGGIALCYQDSKYWQVELVQRHGPNVISFELVTGRQRYPVVGAYIPPADISTIEYVERALGRFQNSRRQPLLLGDLNVDLASATSA